MRSALLFCAAAALVYAQAEPDALLRAMKDEVDRSKTLQISSLDKPYFIEYTVEDLQSYSVSAMLGGVLSRSTNHIRIPRARVRVGDYEFDNGNYVYSDLGNQTSQLTLDDEYTVLRRTLWLLTDRSFKNGVEAITRKRAALKNMTQPEALADLWKVKPTQKIASAPRANIDLNAWTERVRKLSSVFAAYPEVLSSAVSFDASDTIFYLANSEGTLLRMPDLITTVQVRASGQAKDGMNVRDAVALPVLNEKSLPAEADLRKIVEQVAQNVRDMAAAPVGESYSGPVLFEGVAGAQLVAEVLAPHLALPRRPISEPGRPAPFLPSEFETRVDSRVLPEFLDVVDDPTQREWNGAPLIGAYEFDYEGVQPEPMSLIEKGRVKRFLLTRQPVRGQQGSNGRARIPGAYGANAAAITNLFVRSSESVKKEQLKAQLLKMVQDRGRPYGIIVRKMDFPTTAPTSELRRAFMASAQGGGARPVSSPLQIYRVYPDGKEELIRGLRFRGLSVRALRDILAVSEETVAFSYLNTLAPMSMSGGGYVAPATVVAPSILLEDVELERPQDDLPKPPVVPPPPLSASSR